MQNEEEAHLTPTQSSDSHLILTASSLKNQYKNVKEHVFISY